MLRLIENLNRATDGRDYTGWITPKGKFLKSVGYQSHAETLRAHDIVINIRNIFQHGFILTSHDGKEPTEMSIIVDKAHFLFAKETLEKLVGNDPRIERIYFEFTKDGYVIVDSFTMRFDSTHTALLKSSF